MLQMSSEKKDGIKLVNRYYAFGVASEALLTFYSVLSDWRA